MTAIRLLITAAVVQNRPVREVDATYGDSTSWLYELLARYRREGEAVLEPCSRRPDTNPKATSPEVVDLIVRLRKELGDQRPRRWPRHEPRSSYIRFEASMPNECWQSDFTRDRLTRPDGRAGSDSEILSWLDDCSRFALRITAHHRVTGSPGRSCSPSSPGPLPHTGYRPPH